MDGLANDMSNTHGGRRDNTKRRPDDKRGGKRVANEGKKLGRPKKVTTYQQETQAYEIDEWDEESDMPTGNIEGYRVFSTIQIGAYTFVRAVVDSPTAEGAHASVKLWFAEWKVQFGTSAATQRMTGKMPRAKALKEGEQMAALIAPHVFTNLSEVDAFYAAHRPTVQTYGH